MKYDYLYGTPFEIVQLPHLYHMNSDTEFLGRSLKVHDGDNVLDIGCGSGALMLYAAGGKPSVLEGIDIQEEAVRLANENLQLNGVQGKAICCSLQSYNGNKKYDVIVSNPPYFRSENSHVISRRSEIASARHETSLNLESLFAGVNRLLADSGTFWMVHRPSRLTDILQQASRFHLRPASMRFGYEAVDQSARSVVFAFVMSDVCECRVEKPYDLSRRSSF